MGLVGPSDNPGLLFLPPLFMTPSKTRAPCVDALKVAAAQVIVWHHLCAYGPLSDAALRA